MTKETELYPEIEKFINILVATGLLLNFGEGITIARNINRYRPDYGFMTNVVATIAAHKKNFISPIK